MFEKCGKLKDAYVPSVNLMTNANLFKKVTLQRDIRRCNQLKCVRLSSIMHIHQIDEMNDKVRSRSEVK